MCSSENSKGHLVGCVKDFLKTKDELAINSVLLLELLQPPLIDLTINSGTNAKLKISDFQFESLDF